VVLVPAKTVPLVLILQEITAVYAHRDTPEGTVRPVIKVPICYVVCSSDSANMANLVIRMLSCEAFSYQHASNGV